MSVGSENYNELCSLVHRARRHGKSAVETAAELKCSVEEVESIWAKHPQKSFGPSCPGDNADCFFPRLVGCPTDRRWQRTFKVFADRWWDYRDYCVFQGVTPEDLAEKIIDLPNFEYVRASVVEHRKPQHLPTWLRADVLKWAAKYGTTLNNPGIVSTKALVAIDAAVSGLDTISAKDLSRKLRLHVRKVRRALKVLGWSCPPGRGHKWSAPINGKGTHTTTPPGVGEVGESKEALLVPVEVVLPLEVVQVNQSDSDWVIADLLSRIDVEVHVGPGGSGKTTGVTNEYGHRDAIRCAPTNTIAVGLTSSQHQEWTTIHSGLRIPVNAEWEDSHVRTRLVMVDEFSLVGSELFRKILLRLPPPSKLGERTKLVLMGDYGQLPPAHSSVGDYPLRDLIGLAKMEVPNIRLVEYSGNRRAQAPGLARAIAAIRAGQIPENESHGEQGGFGMALVANDQICHAGAQMINAAYRLNQAVDIMGVSTLKNGAARIADKVVGRKDVVRGDIVLLAETCRRESRLKGLHARVLEVCPEKGFRLGWIAPMTDTPKFQWFHREEFVRAECVNVHSVQGLAATGVVAMLEYSTMGCCTREALYVMVSRAKIGCKLITSKKALHRALSTLAPYTPSPWAEMYARRHGKFIQATLPLLLAAA